MKIHQVLIGLYAASQVEAYPGMQNTISEIKQRSAQMKRAAALERRANDPTKPVDPNEVPDPNEPPEAPPGNGVGDEGDSIELIGDLRPEFGNNSGGAKSEVAKQIADIITKTGNPQSSQEWSGLVPLPGTAKCKADTCCIWRWIAMDMENKFRGLSGRCNAEARAAVRLGFHDAGTWSKFTADYGGADGSIILSKSEIDRSENRGLQNIAKVTEGWYNSYRKYGVSMADIIQMGANVATVVCPLGPRVRSYVGRLDSSKPAVNGLLPDVFADADTLINLFENKTIRAHGLTALVGAHTTSQQHFVNTTRAGDPQDSTPGVWDVKFYSETTGTAPARVFKFPSDIALSKHPKIVKEWTAFQTEQSHWNEDYAREYIRLSLLGVNNINNLTECSHVLPKATTKLNVVDDPEGLKLWLDGKAPQLSSLIESGSVITKTIISDILKLLGIKRTT